MPFTLRQLRNHLRNRNTIIAYVAISTICVISGPFTTGDNLSFFALAAYWFGLNALIFLIAAVITLAIILNPKFEHIPRLALLGGGAVAIGLLIGLLIYVTNFMIWGSDEGLPGLAQYLAISLPIAFVITMTIALMSPNDEDENTHSISVFYRRLPVHLGRDLLFLSMQDHYVEAVTAKGSHLILMRFSDALDELKDVDGLRVHRSHWVAREAVADTYRKKDRLFLVLRNGVELPVSRNYLADVRRDLQI